MLLLGYENLFKNEPFILDKSGWFIQVKGFCICFSTFFIYFEYDFPWFLSKGSLEIKHKQIGLELGLGTILILT